jgi:outer membrane protein assembly factor BamB
LAIGLLPLLLTAAGEWPQFRGNPQLTGVAADALPANLKLLWTYESGDSIESSAAISGGSVYVGAQPGELLAIDLQTGKLRWKYKAQEGIAESSPAVHDGVVYIGDSSGLLHAVRAADGKGLWTFKTEGEIKSSPVVTGDRVLIGSYDGNLYCLSARDGKLLWTYTTSNFVHATPSVENGVIYLGGCDEVFRGVRLSDGQEVMHFPAGGYTAASPAIVGRRAYFGTFSNDVVAADLRTKRRPGATRTRPRIPVLLLGGRGRRPHRAGRPRQTGSLPERQDRQSDLDVSHSRANRLLARHRRRQRLHRFERWPFLRAGSRRRQEALGFRSRRALSASPAIAEGRVVIGAQDGRLFCFGQANP